MNYFINTIALTFTWFSVCAQENILVEHAKKTQVESKQRSNGDLEVEFTLGTVYSSDHGTDGISISLDQGGAILEKGAPDLSQYARSFINESDALASLEITSSDFIDFPNVQIAPSKGNLDRTVDIRSIPFEYGEVYTKNAFYPSDVCLVSDKYTLRDYQGQTLRFNPIQYNPVTKVLRVYKKIKVNVSGVSNRNSSKKNVGSEWNALYEKHFMNFTSNTKSLTALNEQGSLLIISDPMFAASMQPFIQWKKERGLPTELVTTTVTGLTSDQIKSYIENYYQVHPELKFILLVGDDQHIPAQMPDNANGLGGPSDNFYGYLTGNDSYSEVFVGRFSAENLLEVETQVQRSIEYEKSPLVDSFFGKAIGIASNQGPGDDGELDYEHMRVIRDKLLNFTYSEVDELYDGSNGGLDANGDPNPTMVVDLLNQGRGLINYTGHGWEGGCATSSMSSGDVLMLENAGKLPFFISVACVNGNFLNGTCFAETWLRSTNIQGQPVGAVATLMSTINQSWSPPMEGQDAMIDAMMEIDITQAQRTFGGIATTGCARMNDTYTFGGYEMTDTWTLFGDPSLLVRTDSPAALIVQHPVNILPMSTSMLVMSNQENAFVSITLNGEIIGTGTIVGGQVTIVFNTSVSFNDSVLVTVTGFNLVPYQSYVPVSSVATDVNYISTLNKPVLYPNPSQGVFSVLSSDRIQEMQLFDLQGRMVHRISSNAVQSEISVKHLDQGVYSVVIISENGYKTTQALVLTH